MVRTRNGNRNQVPSYPGRAAQQFSDLRAPNVDPVGGPQAPLAVCDFTHTNRSARHRASHIYMTRRPHPTVVSLFTGAGGLDLGLEAAGFRHKLCVEIDEDSRATLRANRARWRQSEPGNIHLLTPKQLLEQARTERGLTDLLAGGPPCQPFSKSGYWLRGDSQRLRDPRASTLSAYLNVVEALLPRVILLENVRGLAFSGKDEGLQLLNSGLKEINTHHGTQYTLQLCQLNTVHFGVPQLRERVFIVASRDGRTFQRPAPQHGDGPDLLPVRTAWDAIGDLDSTTWPADLNIRGKWADLLPSIPEGENYLWHTPDRSGEPLFGWRTRYWSFLLKLAKKKPSWTIQADPGPATGPFHWRNRYLSMRELARLQTFPDNFSFSGELRSVRRQIGNAVPCAMGEVIGVELRRQLLGQPTLYNATFVPAHRDDCPKRQPTRKVPQHYMDLCGEHPEHPGKGQGPGARQRDAGWQPQSTRIRY